MGCGIMELDHTSFEWTLTYDEYDLVLEGTLEIEIDGRVVTAGPGQIIYIPKNSHIHLGLFLLQNPLRSPAVWLPPELSARSRGSVLHLRSYGVHPFIFMKRNFTAQLPLLLLLLQQKLLL